MWWVYKVMNKLSKYCISLLFPQNDIHLFIYVISTCIICKRVFFGGWISNTALIISSPQKSNESSRNQKWLSRFKSLFLSKDEPRCEWESGRQRICKLKRNEHGWMCKHVCTMNTSWELLIMHSSLCNLRTDVSNVSSLTGFAFSEYIFVSEHFGMSCFGTCGGLFCFVNGGWVC